MVNLLIISGVKIHFFQQMAQELPDFIKYQIIPVYYFRDRYIRQLPSPRILKILKGFQPNVVLTDYPGYPGLSAKFYQFITQHKIPLLTRLHGNRWLENDLLYHSLKMKNKLISKILASPRESLGLKLSNRILPICKWLDREVRQRFPEIHTKVIYQGINPDFWQITHPLDEIEPPAVGILQDHNISLKVNGLLQFLKVIKEMEDVNFYLAGGGSYTPVITRMCSQLKNAFILPRITPENCKRFYSSINAYVLASGLDCCPTTILEAALMELPVIASRVGGVPEIIQEGKIGWTVKNGDLNGWKAKIRTLLDDESLAKAFGKNGRNFVKKNFNWKLICKEFLAEIFETLNV